MKNRFQLAKIGSAEAEFPNWGVPETGTAGGERRGRPRRRPAQREVGDGYREVSLGLEERNPLAVLVRVSHPPNGRVCATKNPWKWASNCGEKHLIGPISRKLNSVAVTFSKLDVF